MNDDNKSETSDKTVSDDAAKDPAAEKDAPDLAQNGPKVTNAPGDPLAGVKKGAADVMASMEGKTVSMKVYIGTIVGVVILMLLARCGG